MSEELNEWYRQRIEQIHDQVSVFDVLRANGVEVKQFADDQEEQISCPFHGVDEKPSARVYPGDARSHSHVWCFVCRERWDCIALWRKFNGGETKFGQALAQIEQAYGIKPPDEPKGHRPKQKTQEEKDLSEFDTLYGVCERRLRESKKAFHMQGYMTLGSILDRVHTRVTARRLKPSDGISTLRNVLDKIGEKERACPEG